jgi:predicted O-linked N-acetylglucosamine transferase (SPINDLY family)
MNRPRARLSARRVTTARSRAPTQATDDIMTIHVPATDPSTAFYVDCIRKSADKQLSIVELFQAAKQLANDGQKQMAAELYKIWISYNHDHDLVSAVYFNYGMALVDNNDRFGGINALRECLRIKPEFHSAYINLGRMLEDAGQAGAAVTQWMKLLDRLALVNGEAVGLKLTALQQIGRVLRAANENPPAEDCLRQSLEINPNQTEIIQHWIAVRQAQCKWPAIESLPSITKQELIAKIFPWSLANHSDDPMFQFATAYAHNKRAVGVARRTKPAPERPARARDPARRLRIGYVSSDFREHAVGFGMTEVIELHDRARFEVFGYYCGISHVDPTQTRIKAGVDHWLDINPMSDEDAANRITADGIDILVDLNGYTMNARNKVFAFKPAPVIVNWFGFPSTMGSPYHHYLIADPVIIPEGSEIYYSEKILRMPCYQPNDRKRAVAARKPTRRDVKLPEDAFVFCCLNGLQKLTALTYQRWLIILQHAPNSVLWLLGGAAETNERLRLHAVQHGIAPERIVFAERANNADHLARYPLADLFLDNLPYGAHTTAADALWMGVPVLTLPGRSFASRVCSSLVKAAGIGEMVCQTPHDYVTRAIDFAQNPKKMAAIKQKLAKNRASCLLFDTNRLVTNLEGLYTTMWEDYRAGRLPAPDLANLDVYHEIGCDLDHAGMELLSEGDYRALYHAKLAEWNETYPIKPDGRLWDPR